MWYVRSVFYTGVRCGTDPSMQHMTNVITAEPTSKLQKAKKHARRTSSPGWLDGGRWPRHGRAGPGRGGGGGGGEHQQYSYS